MSQVIHNLAAAGFKTDSYFAVARQVNDQFRSITKEKAVRVMKNLFGFAINVDDDIVASVALRYMIAEAVRKHIDGFVVTVDDVKAIGIEKTREFFSKNSWLRPSFKGNFEDVPVDCDFKEIKHKPFNGKKTKSKTGTKLEAAKKIYEENRNASRSYIIDLFINQLGMTKAGATTYSYLVMKANRESTKRTRRSKS